MSQPCSYLFLYYAAHKVLFWISLYVMYVMLCILYSGYVCIIQDKSVLFFIILYYSG